MLTDSLIKQGEDLCNMVECIFGFHKDSDIIDKYKFYCNFLLSLDKDEVNSETENYYEKCQDFLNKLNQISNSVADERDFISKMEYNLVDKAQKLCEVMDAEFKDDNMFNLEKCYRCTKFVKRLRSDLRQACDSFDDLYEKYLEYKEVYTRYPGAKDKIKNEELRMAALKALEDKKLDMRHMKVINI